MRRAERLRKGSEFAAVYHRGRPHRSDLLILRALRTDASTSRFGFTAAKTLGNAVLRNRLRRRLKEAARSLPVAGGWDLVINSRRGAASASYDQLRSQIRELLGRAGVLKESAFA